jgi:hypothetical protein
MVIAGRVDFFNDGTQASEGIVFGDGTEAGTMEITFGRASFLVMNSGYLTYDII